MNKSKNHNLKKLSIVTIIMLSHFLWMLSPVYAARSQATGKITMLRVHDVGTKYGPANDQIDTEVVIHLNTQSGKAFGFTLRNDNNRIAHQGMLDILRDAFNFNHNVTIGYDFRLGNDVRPAEKNGTIVRVWLTK